MGGFYRSSIALAVLCHALRLVGQEAVLPSVSGIASSVPVSIEEVPFTESVAGVELENQGGAFWLAGSAQRALASGLYDLSYSLATRAESMGGESWKNFENSLVIVDSLLARTEWMEARSLLASTEWARIRSLLVELSDANGPPSIFLRKAMMAFAENNSEAVSGFLAPIEVSDLTTGDAAWFWLLSAWGKLVSGDREDAEELFARARDVASESSPALEAQINYLAFRSMLEFMTASAETIPQLQNAMLENAGREIRFRYAQQLAALLYDSGALADREAAIKLIMESLAAIPVGLAREKAQFQLLATMAAGLNRVEGRQAMAELIGANRFPSLMGIALQEAFRKAREDSGSGAAVLRATLDEIISARSEHALLDQALYYRAVFRFLDEDFLGAEEDAAELQRKFSNSSYRRGMLALQASSAWKRERFRTAASHLQQMRTEFVDLQRDFSLSALIADCYLRAGLASNTREDYRNAAEAYATALSNVSTELQGGPLFFQLVYARLKAGQLDLALATIDDPKLRSLAGPEMIWRAQWMALREMRRVGRESEAYERAQAAVLVESENPFLKLRLLWLTALLSVVAPEPEYTVDWVRDIEAFVASDALAEADPALLKKVLASSYLWLSEAHFALDEPEEALALLKTLRENYAGDESALLSHFSEARYLSKMNQTVDAQRRLVSLADDYRGHRLAPIALFEAALNAAKRGQDTYLDEATQLLQRIASDYPDSEIVFRARLMQADLLRRLNKFGSAEQIYYLLENEYANRPDRYLAQLSMADTLLAQAEEDRRKFDAAVSRLELLMDLPEAPLDLRMEAGYKLGEAWRSKGERAKAKQLFWLLYDRMLVEDLRILRLNDNGRYWLSRCLFRLAELLKEEGKVDQSNEFYSKIVKHRLYGAELARDSLGMPQQSAGAASSN